MERILFTYDNTTAARHIENVMQHYVNHVAAIATEMANFGIGAPSRAMLYDAIYNGGKMLYNALLAKATMPDDATLAEIVTTAIADKMATISSMAESIINTKDVIYNGMAVKNPSLFDWIAMDEHGFVSLDAKRAEMIREECRVYISTETGIRLHNLQKTIVESFQEIHDELHRLMYDETQALHNTAQFVFFHPGALYDMHDDGEGRTIFTPRKINFDPFPVND